MTFKASEIPVFPGNYVTPVCRDGNKASLFLGLAAQQHEMSLLKTNLFF
jgi:hypothetical protein